MLLISALRKRGRWVPDFKASQGYTVHNEILLNPPKIVKKRKRKSINIYPIIYTYYKYICYHKDIE